MLDLAHIRQEYMRERLDESSVLGNPLDQFAAWYAEAVKAGLPTPNAMSLATVSPQHKPSTRIVLLKGVDQGGFVFYTSYASRKGRDVAANASAALLFHWPQLERQIRIEGVLARVSAKESDDYFATRPLGSRHAAIASPQSAPIANRAALEARYAEAATLGDTPARPADWGGYRLTPDELEFWQGRENRLHDRVRYRKAGDRWEIMRLAP